MTTVQSRGGMELLKQLGKGERRQTAAGLHAVRPVRGKLPAGLRHGVPAAKTDPASGLGEPGEGAGQPVAVDVRGLLHLLEALPARHRTDRRPLAGPPRRGHAAGDLNRPPNSRRRSRTIFKYGNVAGPVAAATHGLDQGPGRPRAGPLQGVAAGRRAVAGGLLSLVLSAEPVGCPGLRAAADAVGHDLGRAGRAREGDRGVRSHVRRGRAVRDPRRGQPQAAGQAGFPQARGAGPARLPRPARILSPLRRLVSGAALHHVPGRAAGATQAADRQAGGGRGHLSRQLLPGPAVRVLRSAAVAAGTGAGR